VLNGVPVARVRRLRRGVAACRDREGAFSRSSLRRLAVPDGVERLSEECFGECESLESVDFGAGSRLVEIEVKEFYESSLRRLAVPNGVERLGDECFIRCESLEAVDFGAGSRLVKIGRGAFGCSPRRGLSRSDQGHRARATAQRAYHPLPGGP